MRKVVLVLTNLWLMWLGLMILIVQFNKYSWADPPMVDCDTDAEAAFVLLAWFVWLTTGAMVAWFAGFFRAIGRNLPTITLVFAVIVSAGTTMKYFALIEYSKSIESQCGESASANDALPASAHPTARLHK